MISLALSYPVSANRYWFVFRNRVVLSKEARAYKAEAAAAMARSYPHWRLLTGAIVMRIWLHPKKNKDGSACKRRLDLDNAQKVAIDALNGVAYVDDCQHVDIHTRLGAAVDGGGLLVEIEEGGNDRSA
ncbi:MAG: RusA family crossover junction endodeoxyribonuclease [Betaproteobacteria bacterium]|nr:RusA family crossover junction endodeoxyribonuclease [Betaproteobacteria bacterium]